MMNNMKKLKIAFDVDDTLIIPAVVTGLPTDTPNYETIAIYRWFQAQGHTMIIWSGGGVDYARMWANKLGLIPNEIREKKKTTHVESHFEDGKVIEEVVADIDMAFDDCDVDLAKVNVKVKRVNNNISRKE